MVLLLVAGALPRWLVPALALAWATVFTCWTLTPGRRATTAQDWAARMARVVAFLAFLPACLCGCLLLTSSVRDRWLPAVLTAVAVVFGMCVHGVLANARWIVGKPHVDTREDHAPAE